MCKNFTLRLLDYQLVKEWYYILKKFRIYQGYFLDISVKLIEIFRKTLDLKCIGNLLKMDSLEK